MNYVLVVNKVKNNLVLIKDGEVIESVKNYSDFSMWLQENKVMFKMVYAWSYEFEIHVSCN